jgi:hypothetical protein
MSENSRVRDYARSTQVALSAAPTFQRFPSPTRDAQKVEEKLRRFGM